MKEKYRRKLNNYLSYIRHTLLPIVVYGIAIGLVTGAVVWAYSLAVEFLSEKSVAIYTYVKAHPSFIPLLFAGLTAVGVLSYVNVKLTPEVKGSGVPYAEGIMRGLLPLKWLQTFFAMLFGSCLSFFAGLPLGSEGPSVLLGGCIGQGINEIGGKKKQSRYAWRRQSVTGGASAGFAVAFNAPLAGIIFALEEGHKRFSPIILLPAASSIIVASITANLLTSLTGHGIDNVVFTEFAGATAPTISQTGYLVLLGLTMGIFSVLFSLCLNAFTNLAGKTPVPLWLKILAAFILTGAVGLYATDALGGGAGIIRKTATLSFEWKTLLVLLAIKLFTIIFCSANGVTGGLFIPILSVGAMFGGLMAKLLVSMGMGEEYYNTIVLICMCAFLGGVMRSPVTAIVLVIEMTGQLTSVLWATCLVILLSYFIIELFNIEPIYDNALGSLLKKRFAGKRRKLIECEVEIENGAFAVNRSVRDILWPANTLVIKVKHTDAEGNIIYKMDNDGEKKIRAGDKFIIQAETADFEETYKQICYIIKRPDNIENAVPPLSSHYTEK